MFSSLLFVISRYPAVLPKLQFGAKQPLPAGLFQASFFYEHWNIYPDAVSSSVLALFCAWRRSQVSTWQFNHWTGNLLQTLWMFRWRCVFDPLNLSFAFLELYTILINKWKLECFWSPGSYYWVAKENYMFTWKPFTSHLSAWFHWTYTAKCPWAGI